MEKERLVKIVKIGIALIAIAVVTPVIFLAVQGLIGLAIAGAVGLGIVNFAPVVANSFANWKLKAIKWESKTNPIETMQNVLKEKQEALNTFGSKIRDFKAEVLNFKDKLSEFKTEFPQDAGKFEETLNAMNKLLAFRQQKFLDSKVALEQFETEIAKANAIWKMGLAAASMRKAAGMNEDDFLQKIRTETAIESVQTTLNQAIADLETSLLDEVDTKMLEGNSSMVFDVKLNSKEMVR